MIVRQFVFPDQADRSVFLWGPRKTGKSSWIRHHLPGVKVIDLLQTDVYFEYVRRPALLRERYVSCPLVVIDEVQKVPALLDEVHWLIENRGARFLLTGSSPRKLLRGQANLLGGRAWRREMRPLCLRELLDDRPALDLEDLVLRGTLPPHFLATRPLDDLASYVGDYLKEEIAAEGLTRNLPAFSDFLRVAALSSGELINYENIARECAVSAKTARSYYQILSDTLLGSALQPWRASQRRMIQTDKFYLFEVGVTNFLSRRAPRLGTPEFGRSFEQLIWTELLAYRSYRRRDLEFFYWRTSTGLEVDFVLVDRIAAIEVKASSRVHETDLRGLTGLAEDGPVGQRLVVCLESEPRQLSDRHGIVWVLPWRAFVDRLWAGDLFS